MSERSENGTLKFVGSDVHWGATTIKILENSLSFYSLHIDFVIIWFGFYDGRKKNTIPKLQKTLMDDNKKIINLRFYQKNIKSVSLSSAITSSSVLPMWAMSRSMLPPPCEACCHHSAWCMCECRGPWPRPCCRSLHVYVLLRLSPLLPFSLREPAERQLPSPPAPERRALEGLLRQHAGHHPAPAPTKLHTGKNTWWLSYIQAHCEYMILMKWSGWTISEDQDSFSIFFFYLRWPIKPSKGTVHHKIINTYIFSYLYSCLTI